MGGALRAQRGMGGHGHAAVQHSCASRSFIEISSALQEAAAAQCTFSVGHGEKHQDWLENLKVDPSNQQK
ncbi:hypothetical protein CHARACLAT_017547 [Characodon lateralis]|uniref:Uncharacterized protein n=1 Tax=Characodon lateralis TaxID=208331 RepID=A0ABU7EUF2_9TELE|nr:hypothetical protein [Characodon lateralis]